MSEAKGSPHKQVRRAPRRHSWNRSQSDTSFGPIKVVGVAIAIGLPLLVIGVFLLASLILSSFGTTTTLWAIGVIILVVAVAATLSRRVI